MSILPITFPPKKLAQTISSSATTFKLNNIKQWDGTDLTPADFGTEAYGVFIDSTRTQIEIFKFDPDTIADESVTILARGLSYTGGDVSDASRKFAWPSNDTTVQLGTDAPQLFRDFLSSSNTATVTAKHTYTELPESAVDPVDDDDFTRKAYVDGRTQPYVSKEVTQVTHGFAVGDVIRVSGTNTFTKAQANTAGNAEVAGIVVEIVSPNIFRYAVEGIITTGVPAQAAGTVMFLDPTTAGALTATEPSTVGQVSLPLAIVIENGTSMLFHKYRGFQINTIAGNPIASETVAGVVEQATPAQVAAGTDTGETGAQLFVVPSLMKPEGTAIKSTGETGGTKFLREDGDGTSSWQQVPTAPIDIQKFTSSGTWTKPSAGNSVRVIVIGAGGGGGGGSGDGSTPFGGGGGGGGGGGASEWTFDINTLSATESVTVGVGGGGGAGNPGLGSGSTGTAGGATTFGTKLRAGGGGGGTGGNTNGGTGAGGSGGYGMYVGAVGNGNTVETIAGTGGGNGGLGNQGSGGGGGAKQGFNIAGGAAGTGGATGGTGGNGNSYTDTDEPIGGTGAGGGGGGGGSGPGNGGNGGLYGGGGGGGGSDFSRGGNGGSGANGYCVVITY